MKVHVDNEVCQGHGMCNAVAPTLFPLDDLGYCDLTERELTADELEDARLGAAACPERAITLTSDGRVIS